MTPEPILLGRRRLLLLVSGAALGAAVIFTTVVAPAELGVDPTGFGHLTGLSRLSKTKVEPASPTAGPAHTAAATTTSAFRTDVIEIPLGAEADGGQYELEYKVRLKAGDSLVYSWRVREPTPSAEFYADFHGEAEARPGAAPVMVEYRQATGTSDQGALTAPMDGVHGWYLQNSALHKVVVELRLAGFYTLVPPGTPGNLAGIQPRP